VDWIETADLARKVVGALVLGRRVPLAVNLTPTYRCNLRCAYCGVAGKPVPELDTAGLLALLDQLPALGTRFVNVSGGEPLLRDDLGELIGRCRQGGMRVSVISNGTLVAARVEQIAQAHEIRLSLDGPREINDALRGEGVHDKVLEAIPICQERGLSVQLTAVIHQHNVGHLGYLLEIAERHGVGVAFQPADLRITRRQERLARAFPSPEPAAYQAAIRGLLDAKARGDRRILNSVPSLRHLARWPETPALTCLASRVLLHIEPDGRIFPCDMFPDYERHLVPVDGDLGRAFRGLRLPHRCANCLSGSHLELNLLGRLEPLALLETLRRITGSRE